MLRQSLFFILLVAFVSFSITDASRGESAASGQGHGITYIDTLHGKEERQGKQDCEQTQEDSQEQDCGQRKKRSAEVGVPVEIRFRRTIGPKETARSFRTSIETNAEGSGSGNAGSTCTDCPQSSS